MTEEEFSILCTRVGVYAVHRGGMYYAVSPVYLTDADIIDAWDSEKGRVRPGARARFQVEEAMLAFLSFDFQQDWLMSHCLRSVDPYPLPYEPDKMAIPPHYDSIHNMETPEVGIQYYFQHARRCLQEFQDLFVGRNIESARIEVCNFHPFSYHLVKIGTVEGVEVRRHNERTNKRLSPLEFAFSYEYPRYTQRNVFVQNDRASITSSEVRSAIQKKRSEQGDSIEQ